MPVTTAKALERDIPVTLQVVGRAEAYESVTLKSRVDGQVAAVLFTEGQHVKQGDVLIRLDPTDFAARLQQAEASAARDAALVAKTRSDTARYVALKERNFVSEEKVNDIRTNEAAASANLRASRATVELARLQLTYATIRAPFTGVVGARLVFPGSSIKINDTALAVVNRVRPLLISFSVPEKHLPRLRAALGSGGGKTSRMTVDVSLPGEKSQHIEGEVRFLDNAVDSATGTILMKALLPNADEKLTPGQFLNVTLLLDTLLKAVTVPNEAIQQGAEGNFVFVVKEDSSVEMRKLETAASDGGLTAIGKGLQAGETVVTDGQLRLAPGVKIKSKEVASPENATTPATPTAATAK
ncbi:efflux RND transporter periplasmic adaptor subunit [Propionivibrio sp.]|uniref:efflux RND transporter periplasmic adaptor subunit n=1 Tax=Propionivibrio sp. TaxID=2212460 RepID=UPI003BF169D5